MSTLYRQARDVSERINDLLAKREEISTLISEEHKAENSLQKKLSDLNAQKNSLLHFSDRESCLKEEAECVKQLSESAIRYDELQKRMSTVELDIKKSKEESKLYCSVRKHNANELQEALIPLSNLMTSREKMESRFAAPSQSKVAMRKLQERVNRDLGNHWWKKYISAAFWSNLSTPINICITFFTALTTGQTATSNLLSTQAVIGLGLATLVLSTLNTFFTPHKKMVSHMEEMNKWQELGSQFESVYYSNNFDEDDFERRFKAYEDIQKNIHQLTIKQQTTDADFLTDLIYLCAARTCLKRERWINETTLHQDQTNEITV